MQVSETDWSAGIYPTVIILDTRHLLCAFKNAIQNDVPRADDVCEELMRAIFRLLAQDPDIPYAMIWRHADEIERIFTYDFHLSAEICERLLDAAMQLSAGVIDAMHTLSNQGPSANPWSIYTYHSLLDGDIVLARNARYLN